MPSAGEHGDGRAHGGRGCFTGSAQSHLLTLVNLVVTRSLRRLFNLKRHHWITMSSMFIDRAAKGEWLLRVSRLDEPSRTLLPARAGNRPKPVLDTAPGSSAPHSACLLAADAPLSVVALNQKTGNVDGVMINEGE